MRDVISTLTLVSFLPPGIKLSTDRVFPVTQEAELSCHKIIIITTDLNMRIIWSCREENIHTHFLILWRSNIDVSVKSRSLTYFINE